MLNSWTGTNSNLGMLEMSPYMVLHVTVFHICSAKSQPNIVVIVADDLGYNDVSWHNPDILSPNLARQAKI